MEIKVQKDTAFIKYNYLLLFALNPPRPGTQNCFNSPSSASWRAVLAGVVGSCPGRWVVTRRCVTEAFFKEFAQTLGENSRNQNCLNLMAVSKIPIITGQMLLQLWDMVLGLCSLLRRQRSWEQKLAAWSYHSLFSLTTELFNNTVNNSYTINIWRF